MLRDFWYEFKDLFVVGLIVVVVFSCILSVPFVTSIAGAIWFEQGYCRTQSELATEYNFEWKLFGGCLIETEHGTWVHAQDYINKEWKDIQGDFTIDD